MHDESLTLLVEELHAALRPTGKNYELVLVDDGSTDGSWALLEKLADADEAADRFRRGIEIARKQGNGHARGELETALAELTNRS